MKCVIAILILVACSLAVSAQDSIQARDIRLDPSTNRLILSFTPKPPPLDGNFEVRMVGPQGEERRTAQGIKPSGGLTVALILDTNMIPERLQAAKAAARSFVDRLNSGDIVSVTGFGDQGVLWGVATQVKKKTYQDIERLRLDRSNRRLRESLYQQSELTRKASTSRKAIVLITDGEDDRSSPSSSREYLIQYAKEMHRQHTEVPTYTIAIGEGLDASFHKDLADITGGEVVHAARTEEISARFGDVAQNLLGPAALYRLEIEGPARDGAERTGDVEWKAPGVETRLRLSFQLQANPPLSGGTGRSGILPATPARRETREKIAQDRTGGIRWILGAGIGLVVVVGVLLLWMRGKARPQGAPSSVAINSGSAVSGPPVVPVFSPLVPHSDRLGNEELTLVKVDRQDLPTAMNIASRQDASRPYLTVERGPYQGIRFEIASPVVIIGRGQNADFQLPNDEQLSRAHAEISLTPGGETSLRDMNSTNGTFVNGIQIGTPTRLYDGDRLKIGESELIFRSVVSQGENYA